jgi:hypothetical protein
VRERTSPALLDRAPESGLDPLSRHEETPLKMGVAGDERALSRKERVELGSEPRRFVEVGRRGDDTVESKRLLVERNPSSFESVVARDQRFRLAFQKVRARGWFEVRKGFEERSRPIARALTPFRSVHEVDVVAGESFFGARPAGERETD